MGMRHLTLIGAIALSGCAGASPERGGDIRVQHYAVGNVARETPLRLFFFAPDAPRDIAARTRIARSAIQNDPNCIWQDAPPVVIAEATARLGQDLSDRLLVAPVACASGAPAVPLPGGAP